jgi:carbon dioxide concentrating mechanism protein CcmN
MHSPSLQLHPVSTTHYFVSGDVTIHEGAAIAPGVLLQADPNSKIVIRAGVCIGLGSVLHAHNGTLEIGEGSILGAGVLLIGDVKVGDRACIGSATTVFNRSVERGMMIPPGSLLGIEATTPEVTPQETASEDVYEAGFCPPCPTPETTPESNNGSKSPAQEELPEESDEIESPMPQNTSLDTSRNGSAYGQVYVNQLLGKLFPNQHRLNNSPDSQNDPSADDS